MVDKLTVEQLEGLGFKKNRRTNIWTIANNDKSVKVYCECKCDVWSAVVFDHDLAYHILHDPVTMRDVLCVLWRFGISQK